eukprot:1707180-Rhodomonas_salina.1
MYPAREEAVTSTSAGAGRRACSLASCTRAAASISDSAPRQHTRHSLVTLLSLSCHSLVTLLSLSCHSLVTLSSLSCHSLVTLCHSLSRSVSHSVEHAATRSDTL